MENVILSYDISTKMLIFIFLLDHLRGYGSVSVVGGQGHGIGGGGAGGRIAIHTNSANEYKGALLAIGQTGSSSGDGGGPGTVFIEDRLSEFEYQSRLYLDGNDIYHAKPVIIWEKNPRVLASNETLDNNADVSFDHLMLNKKV